LRIGEGYDVHRFAEGRKLVLGGVEIPYEKGLLGHSDADAALHALMDAMLGALALGDIGKHFPDTDEKYCGISSLRLLEATAAMVRAEGYALVNADITIVAQRPKLAPYIPEMRRVIADTLGADMGDISVKATTEEGLGFTGSGEGLAARAVVLMEKMK
jgi:2-C-methyl-D-erythritol 2,4-cyclodiphosphate synthase